MLRFLVDTDPTPTTPDVARTLRARLNTQPGPTTNPALDARAATRAHLRWRQLNDATNDRAFQVATINHLVERLRVRTAATPQLWAEAASTWYAAYRSDMDQLTPAGANTSSSASTTPWGASRGAKVGDGYAHTHRTRVHDLVWGALTAAKVWIRSAPPAAGVVELGCVFSEDNDHRYLLIPAAAHQDAEYLCPDAGFNADDVATAVDLRPGAGPDELADLATALAAAREI